MLGQALKAIHKATLPALAADEQYPLVADASGRLVISSADDLAAIAQQAVSEQPVPVSEGFDHARLAADGAAVLKTGPGVLGDVFFNDVGSAAALEFFDDLAGASGSLLRLHGATVVAGRVALPRLKFYTGLTVVVSGAPDVTVGYL